MQKKIIALAIAAAISAPAFADTSNVTVYGKFDMSYDSIKTGNSTAGAQGISSNRISSNTTLLGLKGSEDLGDGLSAIWQIESLVTPGSANTANTLGTRNTFAGLSSAAAGTVLLGRHDTPYKISTRAYDVFGDGIADNRSIMGGGVNAVASFDGRQDQVVAYISPKLGGVATLAIGYVALSPLNNIATQSKNTATSVAGMFDIGSGFGAALAYEVHDLGAGNFAGLGTVGAGGLAANTAFAGAKEKATKIGATYTQDAINVNFAYEKSSDNAGAAGANAEGHSNYYLSGKYSVTANDAVKLAYAHAGQINGLANTDSKQVTVGYDHSLSKRTTVYALYTKLSNGSAAAYQLGSGTASVGGYTTLAGATAANAALGAGASPSALAFGLKHTF